MTDNNQPNSSLFIMLFNERSKLDVADLYQKCVGSLDKCNSDEEREFFQFEILDNLNMRVFSLEHTIADKEDKLQELQKDSNVFTDEMSAIKKEIEGHRNMYDGLAKMVNDLFLNKKVPFHILLHHADKKLLSSIFGKKHPAHLLADGLPEGEAKRLILSSDQEMVSLNDLGWFHSNFNRNTINHRLFYKKKFTLHREESEGYSLLYSLLFAPGLSQLGPDEADKVVSKFLRTIGKYQICRNRALDLVLEGLEHHLSSLNQVADAQKSILNPVHINHAINIFRPLIHSVSPKIEAGTDDIEEAKNKLSQNICFIICFKLKSYDKQQSPPTSFLLLIATLLKYEVIKIEHFWDNLGVPDGEEKVRQYHLDYVEVLNKEYQFLENRILDTDLRQKMTEEIDKTYQRLADLKSEEFPRFLQLRLLACLIKINDIEDFEFIIESIWDDLDTFDLEIHREILDNFYRLATYIITPLAKKIPHTYRTKKKKGVEAGEQQQSPVKVTQVDLDSRNEYTSKGPIAASTSEELIAELQKVMKHVGVLIGQNASVFYTLLRTINYHYIDKGNSPHGILKMISESLLPAISIISSVEEDEDMVSTTTQLVEGIEFELWQILKKFHHTLRFRVYDRIQQLSYLSNLQMLRRFIILQNKFSRWARRIVYVDRTASQEQIDKQRSDARFMGSCGNYLLLGYHIVQTCTQQNNWIPAFLQTLERGNFSDLAFDMINFNVIRNLVENKEAFSAVDDEGFVEGRLTNLAQFTSKFYLQFFDTDLEPLFQICMNRLKLSNQANETIMLSTVLSEMFGFKELDFALLSKQQFYSLAGGLFIKLEMMKMTAEYRKTKKSQEALIKYLFSEESLEQPDGSVPLTRAFKLMVCLAQQTQFTLSNDDDKNLTKILNLYDKVQGVFNQVVDTLFLLKEERKEFQKLVPPEKLKYDILAKEYNLPFQYVFAILRKSHKPLYIMSDKEFEEITLKYSDVYENTFVSRNQYIKKKAKEYKEEGYESDEFEYFDEEAFVSDLHQKTSQWKSFKREIFTIFWLLELQDIHVPEDIYEEVDQQKQKDIEALKIAKDRVVKDPDHRPSEVRKVQKEIDWLESMKKSINSELIEGQKPNHSKVFKFLQERLPTLFESIEDNMELTTFFWNSCLLPRILFSPQDALFSIKFLKVLINLRVPKLNLIKLFSQMLVFLLPNLHNCTLNEAENMGTFLIEWYEMIERWLDPQVWEQECSTYTGFQHTINAEAIISHDIYVNKIVKMLNKNLASLIRQCFKDPKLHYMKSKCALKLLFRIHTVFPKCQEYTEKISSKINDSIIENEKTLNQDVVTLAKRYITQLKRIQGLPTIAEIRGEEMNEILQEENQGKADDDGSRERPRLTGIKRLKIEQSPPRRRGSPKSSPPVGSQNKRTEKEMKKREVSPRKGRDSDGDQQKPYRRDRRSNSRGKGDRHPRDNRRNHPGRDSGERREHEPRQRKQQLIQIDEVDEDEGRHYHGGRGDRRHNKFSDNERTPQIKGEDKYRSKSPDERRGPAKGYRGQSPDGGNRSKWGYSGGNKGTALKYGGKRHSPDIPKNPNARNRINSGGNDFYKGRDDDYPNKRRKGSPSRGDRDRDDRRSPRRFKK